MSAFTSRMEHTVDPDQLASQKPADMDLHCFKSKTYPGLACGKGETDMISIFSQRQKVSDEKNVARIHKEMQKVQQQLSVTTDEFIRVAGINANIKDTLTHEQEKTFKMEQSLKVNNFGT